MKYFYCIVMVFICISAIAQDEHYTKGYNDSVLAILIKKVPEENKENFRKFFSEMSDQQRSLFYVMHLPVSSKRDLIKNLDTNYINIENAIILFKELIPMELEVSIEFNPTKKALKLSESIDIWCRQIDKSGGWTPVFQEWNVEISSTKLDSLLKIIHIERNKLEKLRSSLVKANCISVDNKHPTEVGFKRSGMGKYYYVIFDHNLTSSEIKQYNNGCEYIYYKDNIVLMYGSGAIGSQCFPYEDSEKDPDPTRPKMK
jgi:hypothetical protein